MTTTLICGANVVDGSGAAPYLADMLIVNGRIEAIAQGIEAPNVERVEATGAYLTPGFIDVHSHTDLAPFIDDGFLPKARQGVSSELCGVCGLGVAPLSRDLHRGWQNHYIIGGKQELWPWQSYAEYCSRLREKGLALNLGPLLPHGVLRYQLCQESQQPMNGMQLKQLAALADEALDAGALAISLGLIYYPALFSRMDELKVLAARASAYGRPLVVHLRSESDEILQALQELIDLCEACQCRLHISHLKLIGQRNATHLAELLKRIERHQLSFDSYPYHYGSTTLMSLLPPELLAGETRQSLFAKLDQPSTRSELRLWYQEHIRPGPQSAWDNLPALVGWHNILITAVADVSAERYLGLSLAQCAELEQQHPVDFMVDLLIAQQGQVRFIDFYMDEALVGAILAHPQGMVGSDTLLGGRLHPRVCGSFARIIHQFVQKERLLTLPQAIRKMTGLSAATFGIKGRGLIRPGYAADLALFGHDFRDHATIESPGSYASGLQGLWVNGARLVTEDRFDSDCSAGVVLSGSDGS